MSIISRLFLTWMGFGWSVWKPQPHNLAESILFYQHSATYSNISCGIYLYLHTFRNLYEAMIGRKTEQHILNQALISEKPELIAVIGRRRVGKTYLIRNFFGNKLDFELVGLKDGSKNQQLTNFSFSLREANNGTPCDVPNDWLSAFDQLKLTLEAKKALKRKKVVFIDEFPWVATNRSKFLTGFSYFWNSYASKANIIVIICGSAAAWMIKKVINNKGGLHNRVTRKILLQPFTLAETEAYFLHRKISFDRYQILQLYMVMGGIPHYLDQVEKGESAVQNINRICFHPQGLLRTEFDNLFSSLFTNPEKYEALIIAFSASWKGLSRSEIPTKSKIKDGGYLTRMLMELEQSGFISSYSPFGHKAKNTMYRLSDNYSLFYLKFIRPLAKNEIGNWDSLSLTQSWKSWSGYAYENICLQHIPQIKIALGISGIHSTESSFFAKATEKNKGTQIDLLIDRQDQVISMCEIKFYNDILTLTKKSAEKLREKRTIFKQITKTKKHIFIVLITTYGLNHNQHSSGLIDNILDMNDLF